ncbi:hypothetical protein HYPSUDRAFT_126849 [Hypholoma sublateritium FD-334 SS-4]|uniref:Uncharacterized protein n=1 Tax=Hypholoma sublateritium (strain FD-334 SS-4) TaxID=945553 RepID=A0A0D2QDX3_HYPSF|nr:hypothetical protein HYPSUDRAFT_126849 [Hypholoma sublateritium FD-334 SS-4]
MKLITRLIGSSGSCVVAEKILEADSTIVKCPFDLVITQALAKKKVIEILGGSVNEGTSEWRERQWIATYITFHGIIGPQDPGLDASDKLLHREYLDTLPTSASLRTPLHFTPSELELFKGTNIYGATLDRDREWKTEWNQCRDEISRFDKNLGERFTWEHYLTAATYLSSRAFPSSLLSPTPTLVHSDSTQPILIPGVDALNHERGQPVSWSVTIPDAKHQDSQKPTISLTIHRPTAEGEELFNNYGPKPNSELILGYGFSIPNNPDDTIVLKIGGMEGSEAKKWEIGRKAQGADAFWTDQLSQFTGQGQPPTYEDILDASGMLSEMLEDKIGRLPSAEVQNVHELRPDVVTMFHHYLEGQNDILSSLLDFLKARTQDGINMAREEGIDIVLEESDSMSE